METMQYFIYGARFERGDRRGIVVSFPDVPEAITQGEDEEDAQSMAVEALGLALLSYPARGLRLPRRSRRKGLIPIAVEPEVAAKLAVLDAFRESAISKTEL